MRGTIVKQVLHHITYFCNSESKCNDNKADSVLISFSNRPHDTKKNTYSGWLVSADSVQNQFGALYELGLEVNDSSSCHRSPVTKREKNTQMLE